MKSGQLGEQGPPHFGPNPGRQAVGWGLLTVHGTPGRLKRGWIRCSTDANASSYVFVVLLLSPGARIFTTLFR